MSNKRKKMLNIAIAVLIIIVVVIIAVNNKDTVYNIKAIEYEHVAPDLELREKENADEDLNITPAIMDPQKNTGIQDIPVDQKFILLDPGHGGKDPGCNYDGILESVINLEISMIIKEKLEGLGYKVVMTRESDIWFSLNERSELIKSYEPDFFISIHQNSIDDDTVTHGAETLYYDALNSKCAEFAEYIQNALVEVTGVKDRGIKLRKNLAVLKSINCPGCIIETGFLSSVDERLMLSSKEYQELIADGIIKGMENYIKSLSVESNETN